MFIHALIWKDHAVNIAPVWCDICKFILRACVASSPDDMLDSIQVYSWRRHWDTCFGFVHQSSFVCMQTASVTKSDVCFSPLLCHSFTYFPTETTSAFRRSLGMPMLVMILREPSLNPSPALPSLTQSQMSWCRAIDLIYSKTWGATHSFTTLFQHTSSSSCGLFCWAAFLLFTPVRPSLSTLETAD
jgi:hypothetical protein